MLGGAAELGGAGGGGEEAAGPGAGGRCARSPAPLLLPPPGAPLGPAAARGGSADRTQERAAGLAPAGARLRGRAGAVGGQASVSACATAPRAGGRAAVPGDASGGGAAGRVPSGAEAGRVR